MKAFCIIEMLGGAPDLQVDTPVKGYVLGAQHQSFGLYLIGGTVAQIQAVDALPETLCICTCGELNDTISPAKRSEMNTWKDAHFPSLPDVPASWTYDQVVRELYGRADEHYDHAKLYLKYLGLAPQHEGIKALAIAPDPPNLNVELRGEAWKLITVGDYAIWELQSDEDNLAAIHVALYENQVPLNTLGLIGVVQEFGVSFYNRAVMDYFDHPVEEMLARRDRIADYLEGQGYQNTVTLRAATNEHQQVAGIVKALGYNMNQLWNVMSTG